MNKTEAAYANVLEAQRQAGLVQWYSYEGLRFVLARATQYTPDFVCVMQDGSIEAHEIKGFWRDDARVKIKLAARLFPWVRFVAIRKQRSSWQSEEISP